MDIYYKAIAAILIVVILHQVLAKRDKEIAVSLSVAACAMIGAAAFYFLDPVLDFLQQMHTLGKLDSHLMGILLKCIGIHLTAEIASLICADGGNAALGKAIHIFSTGLMIWLSLPLMTTLMDLIQDILGTL